MMRSWSLIPALLSMVAAPASAQIAGAGLGYGPWLLDLGTASNEKTVRPSASGYVQFAWGRAMPVVRATWAPEADFDPGVTTVTIGLTPFLASGRGGEVYLDLGAGVARIAADNQERRLRSCTPEVGCMFEGVSYDSGWGAAANAGVGVRVSLIEGIGIDMSSGLSLMLVDQMRLFGRLAVGLAWRH